MNALSSPPDLLLDSVLRTSLDGIVLCRAVRDVSGQIVDFRVVRCNDSAVRMVGIAREVMLSQSMLSLDPDGHRSGIFETYRAVVETGLPTHIEHYFSGARVWMVQSLARLDDDDVLASWADITSQKQAERDREHQTELLQAILDNTGSGIAVMESVRDMLGIVVDFRFTHINADAERITTRTKDTLVGELYSTAWPDARTNGVLDWHLRVARTGTPARIDGVNLPVGAYDGWFNVRIRPFGDGVIATFVDVTALKRAELANQQQADLLRSVLDNSLNAIVAFSAVRDEVSRQIVDFRYVAQNEANRRTINRTDEELIGQTLRNQFPHVMQTGQFERYGRVVETGESDRFEQEYAFDTLTGWFEISVSKWGDGIVLTLVDITDAKNHQRQLEQVNRDLLNANDNLRQFAYVASHDLQEPLRKIQSFGDILQNQFAAQLGDAGQDMIGRMQSATGRMSTLIKDVLAYSRISTHREPFRAVPLDQLLTEVCHELQADFGETGGRIDMDGSLPVIQGDRHQLRHLFSNLLANALKFRCAGQPAVVRVACQTVLGAGGPPELSPATVYYEISLTDNGIGFDNKYADRIFQVFQRLHPRQQYTGTGVGLAICKRIVENHRGGISASSLPGQGATFQVYLPQ